MQIEITNLRYIEIMVEKCNKAKAIERGILSHEYLINRVGDYAVGEATRVHGSIGTLNISKKNQRLFERMIDKCVRKQVMEDLKAQIELENTFLIKNNF